MKRKKTILGKCNYIFLVILLFNAISLLAQGTPGLSFTLIDDGTAYEVRKGTANEAHIEIPDTYDGLPVTRIARMGFSEFYTMTSIHIPDSVTIIGENAFRLSSNLTSINIPNSVTRIENFAFTGCSGLTSVTLSENITSIGRWGFSNCESLTSIIIPIGVTRIGENAFEWCTNLNNVIIPESVTIIERLAFRYCTSLSDISLPESLTFIQPDVFAGCNSLTTITIPNNVATIISNPFTFCSSLETILVSPENNYFRGEGNSLIRNSDNELISGTKNSVIPNNVTRISSGAFVGSTNLTSLIVPNSVISIDSGAFYSCTNLSYIFIPSSVTSIYYAAFRDCPILTIYAEAESQPEGWQEGWNIDDRPVIWGSVSEYDDYVVARTELIGNYPNPFNPETTISFSVAKAGNVNISIYNIKGQLVKSLVNNEYSAGEHNVIWNGSDNNGRNVGSGVYFYQMQTDDDVFVRRMVLLK
ncbi:MAG: leucine-rich repeat protein [Candidatus Cloacimonetes bacterium]|nr:leucine-rich repeat protein [Candidatus Cloacimonadota bacterium]